MVSSYKSKIKASKFKCDHCLKLKEEDKNNNSNYSNNSSTEDNTSREQLDTSAEKNASRGVFGKSEETEQSPPQQQHTPPSSNDDDEDEDSIVIAKCLDCNVNLCSNCLLEHQIINLDLNHKLVSLLSKNQHNEVNNNNSKLSDKNGEFYSSHNDKNNNIILKHKLHGNLFNFIL